MRVYLHKNPDDHTVFYVGCGENEHAELEAARVSVKRPTHLARVIRHLWRNKKQPLVEIVLDTPDTTLAHKKQQELIHTYASRQLTNKAKRGV